MNILSENLLKNVKKLRKDRYDHLRNTVVLLYCGIKNSFHAVISKNFGRMQASYARYIEGQNI